MMWSSIHSRTYAPGWSASTEKSAHCLAVSCPVMVALWKERSRRDASARLGTLVAGPPPLRAVLLWSWNSTPA